MTLMQRINGLKTYIGFAAYGILGAIVEWDKADAITWDTSWVAMALIGITTWTGIAFRSAMNKKGNP